MSRLTLTARVALVAAAFVAMGCEDKKKDGHVPQAVTATITSATLQPDGTVHIAFTLADFERENTTIVVHRLKEGDPFLVVCTEVTGGSSSGLGPLTTTAAGTSYTFVWNALLDLGAISANVLLKISPTDSAAGTAAVLDFTPFDLTSHGFVPDIAQLVNNGDGSATLDYSLQDTVAGSATVQVDYSTNNGATFSTCTEIPGAPSDGLGPFAIGSSPVLKKFKWDAFADLGAGTIEIRIRLRANNGSITNDSLTNQISLAVAIVPEVAITSPVGGTQTGVVAINYTVSDADDDPVDVTIEVSTNSGSSYSPCTAFAARAAEGLTSLTALSTGSAHTFLWDAPAQLGAGSFTGVLLRITADDGGGPVAPVTSAPFTVDNSFVFRGNATYLKRNFNGTTVTSTDDTTLPIGNAWVSIKNASTSAVLHDSKTDANGYFSTGITTMPAGGIKVEIFAHMNDETCSFTVRSSSGGTIYSVTSATLTSSSTSLAIEADHNATRKSGAFNIFCIVELINAEIYELEGGTVPPHCETIWSTTSSTGAFYQPWNQEIYLKGQTASDFDEFDDPVIRHEYGHHLVTTMSADDSPAGTHFLDMIEDPTLSWGEGIPSGLGAMWAFRQGINTFDIYWDAQVMNSTGFSVDLDSLPSFAKHGLYNEMALSAIVTDMVDGPTSDDDTMSGADIPAKIWDVVRNHIPTIKPFIGTHDFFNGWIARGHGSAGDLQASLVTIITTNGGTWPDVWPYENLLSGGTVNGRTLDSVKTASAFDDAPGYLDAADYWKVTASTSGTLSVTVTITTGTGAVPGRLDVLIFSASSGSLIAANTSATTSKVLAPTVSAGTYVVQVRSYFFSGGYTVNKATYNITVSTP